MATLPYYPPILEQSKTTVGPYATITTEQTPSPHSMSIMVTSPSIIRLKIKSRLVDLLQILLAFQLADEAIAASIPAIMCQFLLAMLPPSTHNGLGIVRPFPHGPPGYATDPAPGGMEVPASIPYRPQKSV